MNFIKNALFILGIFMMVGFCNSAFAGGTVHFTNHAKSYLIGIYRGSVRPKEFPDYTLSKYRARTLTFKAGETIGLNISPGGSGFAKLCFRSSVADCVGQPKDVILVGPLLKLEKVVGAKNNKGDRVTITFKDGGGVATAHY